MPEGTFTRTWAHPTTAAQFACLWRKEVTAARALGRRVGRERYHELRYEDLVADPERAVRAICAFADLPYEPGMLDYAGSVDVSAKPHQQRLLRPPTSGVRNRQEDMSADDVAAFEAVAGALLVELGYETLTSQSGGLRPALARSAYDVRLGAWNAAASVFQRSPLWRRRHPPLSA
jgi:hypothetical protein